jgi:hypothetical protein
MSHETPIICKPTSWFTFRATVILLILSVFSVMFYIDGTTGYRKKNLEYYLHSTFEKAGKNFSNMKNSPSGISEQSWSNFAKEQHVDFPKDPSLLPVGTKIPMAWPSVLTDYQQMKDMQTHLLWQKYSGENGMTDKAKEKPFDADKIREQIIVFYICFSLAVVTAYIFIRTMRRSLSVTESELITVTGQRIAFSDMKSLDLRKWDTKGIAFIDFEGSQGRGRARIDGLTYGGFKKEHNEPAEQLMRKIREHFSGEIIEYTAV